MVSMKDISIACGVSVATVSKALNDHNDIGLETKKYIKKVADEMGYLPNSMAKALKTRRTYNIGVLFAEEAYSGLTHDYYAFVLDSFRRAQSAYPIWNIVSPEDLMGLRLSVQIFIPRRLCSLYGAISLWLR